MILFVESDSVLKLEFSDYLYKWDKVPVPLSHHSPAHYDGTRGQAPCPNGKINVRAFFGKYGKAEYISRIVFE